MTETVEISKTKIQGVPLNMGIERQLESRL